MVRVSYLHRSSRREYCELLRFATLCLSVCLYACLYVRLNESLLPDGLKVETMYLVGLLIGSTLKLVGFR